MGQSWLCTTSKLGVRHTVGTRVDAWVRVVPLTVIAKGAILELDHVAVVTAARAAATAATSVHRTIPYIRVWLLRNHALLKLWRKCQRTAATAVRER